jgi:hypothetical protein
VNESDPRTYKRISLRSLTGENRRFLKRENGVRICNIYKLVTYIDYCEKRLYASRLDLELRVYHNTYMDVSPLVYRLISS